MCAAECEHTGVQDEDLTELIQIFTWVSLWHKRWKVRVAKKEKKNLYIKQKHSLLIAQKYKSWCKAQKQTKKKANLKLKQNVLIRAAQWLVA